MKATTTATAAAFFTFLAAPALAQDFSGPQKLQIEGIIRDYLLKNPEVLRDAFTALEAKQARAEAEQESVKAREVLREQVAALAVKGAESILRREVNAGVHAELLTRLKAEL